MGPAAGTEALDRHKLPNRGRPKKAATQCRFLIAYNSIIIVAQVLRSMTELLSLPLLAQLFPRCI